MLTVGGGLNYSSVFYDAQGIKNRRQPFTWFLNGNLTFNILDVSIPLTFSYSNNQVAYTQPFNMQSISPKYKWVQAYIGTTSMNFSQYTLSGHTFTGAGVDLTPGKFKFSGMYGCLKKAIEYDYETSSDANMSYKRMGYAASAAYENNGHGVKLIYFSARDIDNSLVFRPTNCLITPMENTVVSVSAKTKVFKSLKLEAEYALSGLTKNTYFDNMEIEPISNKLPLIFKPNSSSQFFGAFKTSLGYNMKFFGISVNYERVDPSYQTLGAYYMNNDFENITIAPIFNLFKGKVNIAVNTGLQRNNLDNNKLNTSNRWVGAMNVSYAASKKLNFNGSFSNFSSFTRQRPQVDPYYTNALDTLNFYQLSQSAMLSTNYNIGGNKFKQSVSLTANYQVSGQNQGNITDQGVLGTTNDIKNPSRIINGNLGHNFTITKSKTSINTSVSGNYCKMMSLENFYLGPNINVSQSFFKNTFRVTLGSSYNQVLTNSVKTNELFNHRFAVNYSPKFKSKKYGKLGLSMSASYLQKLKTTAASINYQEFTGNMGINYSF
jgi:hypothetical protein